MRSVDEIGDELYTLPPTSFTAARDAAVAQARADGDPATARRLAALKRPTYGAFLVNLLALRRPDVVTGLVELGERIQAAQGHVSAADLRDLTNQRRSALAAALDLCRTLAGSAGAGAPSPAQVAEASQTLAAAMADPAAAAQVRAGRVVKALHYAGFGGGFGTTTAAAEARRTAGGPMRPQPEAVRPVPPPVPSAQAPVDPERASEIERERRAQERTAWERLAKAEAGLAAAQAQERAANEEMDRIADEMTRLRGALDTAGHRAKQARAARQAAERELAAARRSVDPPR